MTAVAPPLALDHVVLMVKDLKQAITNFESLGFTVSAGGINGASHNALIVFQDGCYIELIAVRSWFIKSWLRLLNALGLLDLLAKGADNIMRRFLRWFVVKPGLIDWCLRSMDVEQSVAALKASGIAAVPPKAFARTKPNGQRAKWKLAGTLSPGLPFLIEDITDTTIRVPQGELRQHENGVLGIAAITLPACYKVAFGQLQNSGLFSNDTARQCTLGKVQVRLSEQMPKQSQLSVDLFRDHASSEVLKASLTGGAVISLVSAID